MPHLKCYEKGCMSNYCSHCVRDGIRVDEKARCQSFKEKNEDNKDVAEYEYEFACDMGLPSKMDGHPIDCENAMCKFQGEGVCHLNHVRIENKAQGPLCVSYEAR